MLYQIKQLSKTRRIGNVAFQLSIPDFQVQKGEFVAIVGPSGCGKSTLLDLLALVLSPDLDAEAYFSLKTGQDGSRPNLDIAALWRSHQEHQLALIRKRLVGYVLQTGGLLPFLSVEQNIALTCRLSRTENIQERVREMAGRLGIEEQLSKKPGFLSGGERQRVSIARALVHSPAVVLADEPTAAVDKDRARTIVRDFKTLAQEEQTGIIMVTHDQDLITGVADRIMSFQLEHQQEDGLDWTLSRLRGWNE